MPQLTPYQKEALNYKKHIALTANAGSGKTFVLSRRYIEIILNEDIPLNKIVAITFTDKAAGELYKKIANEIDERLSSELNASSRKKLERFRKQLVSANISTIHSFCIDLLREFSPDAGIDANFSPMDSETADELIELSIEEIISGHLMDNEDSEKIKYLIRILGSKLSLSNQLKQLINQRKNILKLYDDLYSKSINDVAKFFHDEFKSKFELYFTRRIEILFNTLEKLNNEILLEDSGDSVALEVKSLIEQQKKADNSIIKFRSADQLKGLIFTQKLTLKIREYVKKLDKERFEDEIKVIEKTIKELNVISINENSASADVELARFGKIILEVFKCVLDKYEEKKNEKGYLDFEDILINTKNIVAKENVREKLSEKFEYIMLDEYQDTNEIQYEIFMPILENLNKGNLFVVGDEKQSIYMFRDAELEIFNRTKKEIENKETSASLLQLPHSFRMSPPIAAFTNILFDKLFKDPIPEFNEVKPSELICSKDENEPGKIEILVPDEISESDIISRRIAKLLDDSEDLEYKDIAILCRKRNAFAELEKSFSKHKIPFTIIGGKGYYQRQIIYDVYNYLSFLINPENDAALVGILRSPFFTISDANIYEISQQDGNSFFEKLKSFISIKKEFQQILNILEDHLSFALRVELNFLLRKILRDTNYWAVISSKPNSAQEVANLNKLLRISNSYLLQGLKTIYDFVNYLSDAMEMLEDEGQAAVSKDENTVKIMTIHQAKGLEYKAVFLFKCSDYSKDEHVKAKGISIDKNFGILTKIPVDGNYFEEYSTPPIAGIYDFVINKKLSAEAKRLLYVAVTRAVNYLFISFSQNSRTSDSSFINFISDGLNIDFEKAGVELNSSLKFMSLENEKYEIYEKELNLNIPIVRNIDEIDGKGIDELKDEVDPKIISIDKKEDSIKNEIVSATKTAMYLQCPLKYKLTYELGYSKILKIFNEQMSSFDYNYKEDDETNELADLRGRVIHSVLEKELDGEELTEIISEYVDRELELRQSDYKEKDAFINSIKIELTEYYNSSTYKKIKSYNNFKNEFEIYTKEYDYYLYGIIDKIIIDEKKIVIVDYKTDKITLEQIEERGTGYLPQLKFYAYLAKKMFPEAEEIKCSLVFIKHPENVFEKIVSESELAKYKSEVNNIVNEIRKNNFPPNLSHCAMCHFAVSNGKCVMPAKQ